MNTDKNIIFELSKNEKFIFELPCSIKKLLICDEIKIIYSEKNNILLADDCFLYLIRELIGMLSSALNNDLQLHGSINKDIGFMWNQELHGEPGLIYNKSENQDFWVGLRYYLWETPGRVIPNLTTWLYNNSKGEIILDITPDYPWHHLEPEPSEKFISYDDFMKNYKPFLIKTISHEVAKKWLTQAENLLKIVEENEKRAREEYYSSLAQKENK